jgi:hypothetical protein
MVTVKGNRLLRRRSYDNTFANESCQVIEGGFTEMAIRDLFEDNAQVPLSGLSAAVRIPGLGAHCNRWDAPNTRTKRRIHTLPFEVFFAGSTVAFLASRERRCGHFGFSSDH